MIVNASRKTDIPSYYSDWFLKRIKAGFFYIRHPMDFHQISKISLSPETVNGIVFWTKNPTPMLDKLDTLKDYMYYFQFTINSYSVAIERNLPRKNKVIIPAFQRLSDLIGPDRVVWRYDPIFLNELYTIDHHILSFEKLAKQLSSYTEKCAISFLDFYQSQATDIVSKRLSIEQQEELTKILSEIAHSYNLQVGTCAEGTESQLLMGNCTENIDIGEHNTCRNGCRYCPSNSDERTVRFNSKRHNPDSPLFIGDVGPYDKITG